MPKVVLLPDPRSRGLWQANTPAIELLTSLLSTHPITTIGQTRGNLQVRLFEGWAWSGGESGALRISAMLNCQWQNRRRSELLQRYLKIVV